MLKKGKIKNILKEDDLYPEVSNPDFSSKIYKKREFYFHKIPQRKKLNNYEEQNHLFSFLIRGVLLLL